MTSLFQVVDKFLSWERSIRLSHCHHNHEFHYHTSITRAGGPKYTRGWKKLLRHAALARLKRWRVVPWWLTLIIPCSSRLPYMSCTHPLEGECQQPRSRCSLALPSIDIGLFSCFFEEMGWSGFMLPQVQRRFNPLLAALLVGLFRGGI